MISAKPLEASALARTAHTGAVFAAATLPFPPQLVSLCEEDRKLKHNYWDTLVNITTRIREMNRGDNHPHIPTDMGCSYHATQQSGRTR